MGEELVLMSTKEIDRLSIVQRVLRDELTRVQAAALLGLSTKQTSRLCAAVAVGGPAGLISKKRGRTSNRKIAAAVETTAVDLVRQLYEDFGPTLAREKLLERHGIRLGKETVRRMLMRAGVWLSKDQRIVKPHQPRFRRDCYGELVQIDGCEHHWFENR